MALTKKAPATIDGRTYARGDSIKIKGVGECVFRALVVNSRGMRWVDVGWNRTSRSFSVERVVS